MPENMPELPRPAIARPTIRTVEEGATPQIKEPSYINISIIDSAGIWTSNLENNYGGHIDLGDKLRTLERRGK